MTIERCIEDIRDAVSQAKADGTRGTGQRGVWSVVIERGVIWLYLWISVERGNRRWVRAAIECDSFGEEYLPLGIIELYRMAHADGTDLQPLAV